MRLIGITALVVLATACNSGSPTAPTTSTTASASTSATPVAAGVDTRGIYAQFQSAVTVAQSGTTVSLRSNGVPDHVSPYWGRGHAMYEAPHAGMVMAPNQIATQSLSMQVAASPAVGTASDTPLGPIGIAVNGVAIFNQYAAGRSPLAQEILTFDRFNGHPQQTGQYHYHVEPLWLTSNRGADSLIGVLLDGFPVYGPRDQDGSVPSALDSCNGHTHATREVPAGIYHYHVVSAPPYISGCFRGAAGRLG
ncbi:hypothetical protein TBR22_A30170 [Luteitalea sp. TBR-22]|uniref:YHYH protein n=1 Tax=Luteitalea sp. TBR-22 TaxID=2802971 RepID=UPI001AF62674|nr:YHYH protein [Luteitalea sp. TBR-22]BCS33790.1 hypothetical protein TBR22_A30170 [Luteitalea sp. TBR-22]